MLAPCSGRAPTWHNCRAKMAAETKRSHRRQRGQHKGPTIFAPAVGALPDSWPYPTHRRPPSIQPLCRAACAVAQSQTIRPPASWNGRPTKTQVTTARLLGRPGKLKRPVWAFANAPPLPSGPGGLINGRPHRIQPKVRPLRRRRDKFAATSVEKLAAMIRAPTLCTLPAPQGCARPGKATTAGNDCTYKGPGNTPSP